jgi:hypothetical protein
VITLTVKNNTTEPVTLAPQVFFIPSTGKYQSYVGRIPEGITLAPGETREIPVEGYCTDVHTPPVPEGTDAPPIDTWIPVKFMEAPDPLNPWPVIPADPVDPFHPSMIPEITASPAYTPARPGSPEPIVTYPGTDIPVRGTLDPDKDPRSFAPVIIRIVEEIETAADVIQLDPSVVTPFGSDPVREREAIIQQTIWIAMGALVGEPYEKEDFEENVYTQFTEQTGVRVTALNKEEKENIDTGVDQFWTVFMATGVEAKVLKEDTAPSGETGPGKGHETTVPGLVEETKRRCLRFGEDPSIDTRTGYDLIGDLYRHGKIPSDYLNDVRGGDLARKVNEIRAMHHTLQNALSEEYNVFPCDESTAHRAGPQRFPEFPWEDVFLTVDLCADNSGKTHLYDFLDSNADISALNEWMEEFETAIDNLGLWRGGEGSYMQAYNRMVARAMEGIGEAYQDFQDDMYVAMALRFNRSRAEARFWSAVTTIAAAAVSAGIGAAAGGAMAALASAFASTSGFIWDQGLQAMGMDPGAAGLISSLMTMCIGVSSGMGAGLVEAIGEEVVTGLPGQMIESGGAAMAQQQVQGFVMGMTMLNDDNWDALIEELSEDYNDDAIARFNEIREAMRAEIARHVQTLCEIYNSLDQLLPAVMQAREDAEEWLHSSYWRKLWQDAMDRGFDCCCEWSDGSAPGPNCVVTVPEFGHDPRQDN